MAAKKKETQSTEKTSPVKSMTVVELRVIFDRLRKKYNEGYDEDTFEETVSLKERINAVHKLTYLGDLLSANKGTDRLFTGKELDAIVQYIYEIAEYVFNENKSEIDSYFEFYSSATLGEHNLILRLMDNEWPFSRIKEYINKIRRGEVPHRLPDKPEFPLYPFFDSNKTKHDDSVDALVYGLQKKDMVNHPPHYNVGGFEVIDIIKTFTEGLEGIQAVDTANAIKYILRWHRKNGVEDLKKAKWYIEHLIKEIEDVQ